MRRQLRSFFLLYNFVKVKNYSTLNNKKILNINQVLPRKPQTKDIFFQCFIFIRIKQYNHNNTNRCAEQTDRPTTIAMLFNPSSLSLIASCASGCAVGSSSWPRSSHQWSSSIRDLCPSLANACQPMSGLSTRGASSPIYISSWCQRPCGLSCALGRRGSLRRICMWSPGPSSKSSTLSRRRNDDRHAPVSKKFFF